MPRISLITDKSELPSDRHAEFDRIVEILHRVGGPFGVLMYSPGLAQKVCEAGAWVRLNSTLAPVERELAIIAVAREKDAAYEWASHVRTGRSAGLREVAIEAVRKYEHYGAWAIFGVVVLLQIGHMGEHPLGELEGCLAACDEALAELA